jgi:signal transduction histidine kinase
MRLLIHELRPPALDQESLVDALRKRFDAVENHVGVEGRVVMDDFVDLPSDVEDGLYRIAQEALNNALKHAQATREGELVIWSSPGAGTTVTVSVPLRNPIPPMGAEG